MEVVDFFKREEVSQIDYFCCGLKTTQLDNKNLHTLISALVQGAKSV